jgi:filamentous hemagglutinin family protein
MSGSSQGWALGLGTSLVLGGLVLFGGDYAKAQITPDDTLGNEASVVKPNVDIKGRTSDQIEGGATRGAYLFHSFLEFNVGEGRGAYFANPDGIQNILSRVTGTNPSNIQGTLGVNGSANLFLLNPNGIIFGPNARLDIPGSFVASTANSLELGNGEKFSATNPEAPPLLTINVTPGLQYGANQPGGTIANTGNLAVGQDLTLAAGNLDLQGQLYAGRNLTLQAEDTVQVRDSVTSPFIASAGEQLLVQGNQRVDIFALNHPDSGLFSGGNMVLRSASAVGGDAHYWSGDSFRIERLDGSLGSLESPNDPVIRSRGDVSFDAYEGTSLHILAGGSVNIGTVVITGPETGTSGADYLAGDILLSNGMMQPINGTAQPTLDVRAGMEPAMIGIPPLPGLTGFDPAKDAFFGSASATNVATSANITIGAVRINAPDGVVFLTNQYKPDQSLPGGAIEVGAILTNDFVSNTNNLFFSGNGGSVIIDSRSNITVNNRIDSSSSSGNSGHMVLIADGAVSLTNSSINSSTFGAGKSGDIRIKADSVSLKNGSELNASTNGSGDAGSVTINARNTISLDNRSTIFSRVGQGAGGNAGPINITTRELTVRNGSQLGSGTSGVGNGADMTITVYKTALFDGVSSDGRFPSAASTTAERGATGKPGNINMNTGSVIVSNAARIGSGSYSPEDAGNTTIETGQLILQNGGFIGAQALGQGKPGILIVRASDVIELIGTPANVPTPDNPPIATGFYSDTGPNSPNTQSAGQLTVSTKRLVLREGAQLSAQAELAAVNVSESLELIGTSAEGEPTRLIFKAANPDDVGVWTIDTKKLIIRDGAQVSAETVGEFQGGLLVVNASESVEVDGISKDGQFPSSLQLLSLSEGDAIGMRINTGKLIIANQGQVVVVGKGGGSPGELNILADSMSLINNGKVRATTVSGEGGNINLDVDGIIWLRDNSEISTEARGSSNGGNITINADFVFAILSENSDIVAIAYQGPGGDILINALLVEEFNRPGHQVRTKGSDISVNSNQGTNGTAVINTQPQPQPEPLPEATLPPLVEQRCQVGGGGKSSGSFIQTGRGGLPPNPTQTFGDKPVWIDMRRDIPGTENSSSSPVDTKPIGSAPKQIVEAQGWVINDKGQVELVAVAPQATLSQQTPVACNSQSEKVAQN